MNAQLSLRAMPKWMLIVFAIEAALGLGFLVLGMIVGGSYPMPSAATFANMIPLLVPLALVGTATILCLAALRRDHPKMAALWTFAPLVASLAFIWTF